MVTPSPGGLFFYPLALLSKNLAACRLLLRGYFFITFADAFKPGRSKK